MAARRAIDTGVLVGALHARDAFHRPAFEIVLAADQGKVAPLWISDFVLAETLNYLVRKAGSAMARDALRRIEMSAGLRLERISDGAFFEAKNEIFQRQDGLSFVDAVTVAFMRAHDLKEIYSFDSDFDRVPGLRRLTRLRA